MSGPLEGVRVLDLSRVMAGPYATMLLADLGADVVKVERPGKGDDTRAWGPPFIEGESLYFLSCNRNKRSLVIDMKPDAGRDLVKRLAKEADVVVENFRPGTMDRLGLGYEVLAAGNPRLIYGAISGFGLTGPLGRRPGYDLIAQGMGGFMSFTGEEGGGPLKVGLPVADINAGMFLAMGIMAALYEREISGRGQMVDTSLYEGQIAQLTYQAQRYFATGESPKPEGNAHPLIAPYATFRAKDGSFNAAVGNDELYRKFCEAFERPDLLSDPRFSTNSVRVQHRKELTKILDEELFSRRTVAEILGVLERAGIPAGPISALEDTLNHPQAVAREMVVELEHPKAGKWKCTGVPLKYGRTPGSVRTPPPLLGQHGQEILAEWLGLPDEEFQELRARGVVG